MTTRNKRDAKDYKVEKVIETIKVIEALEGANFEPVSVDTIIRRIGIIPELEREIKFDAVSRILKTLKLLGWVEETEKKQWLLGAKILRFSNRYSEVLIANS
jgi:DNA-binding IclR family transcriptional regulator